MSTVPDIRRFDDPRHAVGLLTDVLQLALQQPAIANMVLSDKEKAELGDTKLEALWGAERLCRKFVRVPVTAFGGAKRRNYAKLYQEISACFDLLPGDLVFIRDRDKRELLTTVHVLADVPIRIACAVMEKTAAWDSMYTTKHDEHGNVIASWAHFWHGHIGLALRLDVDKYDIHMREMEWQFRDITERKHHGPGLRDAFAAAWLSGHYKFARELVGKK